MRPILEGRELGAIRPSSSYSRDHLPVLSIELGSLCSLAERDLMLNWAVSTVRKQILSTRAYGILVTRHDWRHFAVEASSTVPFGLTLERDLVRSPAHQGGGSG
ncbi:UNVERIFIED_ORG: hypothetical protein J3D58_003622 [Paenarthrobacter nicotinovorans]